MPTSGRWMCPSQWLSAIGSATPVQRFALSRSFRKSLDFAVTFPERFSSWTRTSCSWRCLKLPVTRFLGLRGPLRRAISSPTSGWYAWTQIFTTRRTRPWVPKRIAVWISSWKWTLRRSCQIQAMSKSSYNWSGSRADNIMIIPIFASSWRSLWTTQGWRIWNLSRGSCGWLPSFSSPACCVAFATSTGKTFRCQLDLSLRIPEIPEIPDISWKPIQFPSNCRQVESSSPRNSHSLHILPHVLHTNCHESTVSWCVTMCCSGNCRLQTDLLHFFTLICSRRSFSSVKTRRFRPWSCRCSDFVRGRDRPKGRWPKNWPVRKGRKTELDLLCFSRSRIQLIPNKNIKKPVSISCHSTRCIYMLVLENVGRCWNFSNWVGLRGQVLQEQFQMQIQHVERTSCWVGFLMFAQLETFPLNSDSSFLWEGTMKIPMLLAMSWTSPWRFPVTIMFPVPPFMMFEVTFVRITQSRFNHTSYVVWWYFMSKFMYDITWYQLYTEKETPA